MSLINDALKQARQAPPRIPQRPLPPLPPDDDEPDSRKVWLIPAIVIVLVFAVVFVIGLASAHRTVRNVVETVTAETVATQAVADVSTTVIAPPPPVVAMPLEVFWSGSDGYFPLYTYDTFSGFLLADGASTTGHATIAADGSSIQFDGGPSGLPPVLATTAAGVTVGEMHNTLPMALPQLQFYFGTALLALVDTTGLWARSVVDGAIPAVAGFEFEYAGVPVMVMNPALCTALAWTALN